MGEQEIAEIYQRFFPLIRAKCARMLRNEADAQDLAQETFTRLWETRSRIRDPDATLAWIYRTATRLAVDRTRRRLEISDEVVESLPDGRDLCTQTAAQLDLRRLTHRLKPQELEIFILSRGDGFTQKEIAELLKLSDRTVRRILVQIDAKIARQKETP